MALKTPYNPLTIGLVIFGSFLGTFVLDIDYLIYAYVLEPARDFSKTLKGFVQHADLSNALMYIEYHKNELGDKTLNSALFQIIFALFAIFVSASPASLFIKALVLSTCGNSIYRLWEAYLKGGINEWFWAFKSKPNKQGIILYSLILLGIFIYCVAIL
ncbi:hypothetical protein A3K42_00455 [candidate division WWE3 bacterium RBG_13_37_7]|uniref:Uncharacterized protein n=1 Tax=candidate division WWE3 bacterium RBG_13_37_7 TaxID=1802609 RepID=A0A1F4U1M6_UNCKA|nr:MAG: hypothetical protein A3K42_00455 [candidate division WWE3 bacterium RBG_13_37_7]